MAKLKPKKYGYDSTRKNEIRNSRFKYIDIVAQAKLHSGEVKQRTYRSDQSRLFLDT